MTISPEIEVSRETVIREATISDLPKLSSLGLKFHASANLGNFAISDFCALWERFFAIDFGVIFVAECNGEIVGSIGGVIHPRPYDLKGPLVAEEFFWFVQPDARGCGIDLYRKFEEWAKRRGAVELQMCHLIDSMPEKLERFYKHEGYSLIEKRYAKTL